jgi:hypothetical protein
MGSEAGSESSRVPEPPAQAQINADIGFIWS